MQITRRELMKFGLGAGASALLPANLFAQQGDLITCPIPSSGEALPVIGIGTARRYSGITAEQRAEISEVLSRLPTLGGKVIDTAAGYGEAEALLGELNRRSAIDGPCFWAPRSAWGDVRPAWPRSSNPSSGYEPT